MSNQSREDLDSLLTDQTTVCSLCRGESRTNSNASNTETGRERPFVPFPDIPLSTKHLQCDNIELVHIAWTLSKPVHGMICCILDITARLPAKDRPSYIIN